MPTTFSPSLFPHYPFIIYFYKGGGGGGGGMAPGSATEHCRETVINHVAPRGIWCNLLRDVDLTSDVTGQVMLCKQCKLD